MDIIDTAAEIGELQRNAALSAHRINRNADQLSIALNAARISRRLGALPFPAARPARIARASSN